MEQEFTPILVVSGFSMNSKVLTGCCLLLMHGQCSNSMPVWVQHFTFQHVSPFWWELLSLFYLVCGSHQWYLVDYDRSYIYSTFVHPILKSKTKEGQLPNLSAQNISCCIQAKWADYIDGTVLCSQLTLPQIASQRLTLYQFYCPAVLLCFEA